MHGDALKRTAREPQYVAVMSASSCLEPRRLQGRAADVARHTADESGVVYGAQPSRCGGGSGSGCPSSGVSGGFACGAQSTFGRHRQVARTPPDQGRQSSSPPTGSDPLLFRDIVMVSHSDQTGDHPLPRNARRQLTCTLRHFRPPSHERCLCLCLSVDRHPYKSRMYLGARWGRDIMHESRVHLNACEASESLGLGRRQLLRSSRRPSPREVVDATKWVHGRDWRLRTGICEGSEGNEQARRRTETHGA
jgi:hypothetical protein